MVHTFKLKNLGCACCAAKMQDGIQALPGVHSARINFLTTKLVIDADEDDGSLLGAAAEKVVKQHEPHCELVRI